MADNSMETMISTSLSILAVFASAAALIMALREPERPSILIYDPELVAEQAEAYSAAGQDPLAVIDTAVEEAISRGFFVVDARIEIKGPPSALLQLEDFVEVGGEVGQDALARSLRALPGTVPVDPSAEQSQVVPQPVEQASASVTPLGSDVEDIARQLMGGSSSFTPALPAY